MSIVAKVLGGVLIKRIVAGTDAELIGEQAGFRKGRNTTEQIFVLRNIVEQEAEWNPTIVSWTTRRPSTAYTETLSGRS